MKSSVNFELYPYLQTIFVKVVTFATEKAIVNFCELKFLFKLSKTNREVIYFIELIDASSICIDDIQF